MIKHHFLFSFLLLLVGVTQTKAQMKPNFDPPNLVTNGGFDSGVNNWNFGSNIVGQSGTNKYAEVGNTYAQYSISQVVTLEFNNSKRWLTAQMRFALKSAGTSRAAFGIEFFDSNNVEIKNNPDVMNLTWSSYTDMYYAYMDYPTPTTDWKYWSRTFQAPERAVFCKIYLYKFASSSSAPNFLFDDISLKAIRGNYLFNGDFSRGEDMWIGGLLYNDQDIAPSSLPDPRPAIKVNGGEQLLRPSYRVDVSMEKHWMMSFYGKNHFQENDKDAVFQMQFYDSNGNLIIGGNPPCEGFTWSNYLGGAWAKTLDLDKRYGVEFGEFVRHFISFKVPNNAVTCQIGLRNWSISNLNYWDNIEMRPLKYKEDNEVGKTIAFFTSGISYHSGFGNCNDHVNIPAKYAFKPYLGYYQKSIVSSLNANDPTCSTFKQCNNSLSVNCYSFNTEKACARFFNTILFTDIVYGELGTAGNLNSTTKKQWIENNFRKIYLEAYMNRFFQDGVPGTEWFKGAKAFIPALNEAAKEVNEELGQTTKTGVILKIPWPNTSFSMDNLGENTLFGYIDGQARYLDKEADRIEILKWYVDAIKSKWDNLSTNKTNHLKLLGFYWYDESTEDEGTVKGISEYIRNVKGLKFVHSPYNSSGTARLGNTYNQYFDVVWKQSNYWSASSLPLARLREAYTFAGSNEQGLNLEFLPGSSGAIDAFKNYLNYGIKDFHRNATHLVYDSGGNLWKYASTDNSRYTYNWLYNFFHDTNENVDVPVNVSCNSSQRTSQFVKTAENPFEVYIAPNPTSGKVSVFTNNSAIQMYDIMVLDLQGRDVLRMTEDKIAKSGSTLVDLSQKPSGIYFLRVVTSVGVFTKKVVVKK
ncbi:hypothetical protein BKI52_12395 [marine bacterium AO1-C]|nr:hypothetical protein BKI52_12395 [marine bacterium AO1-C]